MPDARVVWHGSYVQTFVPFRLHSASAAALDTRRLGKQRVETLQIMTALCTGRGWVHHPATKMWAGHERSLLGYQAAVCAEWQNRGHADTCLDKTFEVWDGRGADHSPWWLGVPELHLSHRVNLHRKDPDFYRSLSGTDDFSGAYLWPIEPGVLRIGTQADRLGVLRVPIAG